MSKQGGERIHCMMYANSPTGKTCNFQAHGVAKRRPDLEISRDVYLCQFHYELMLRKCAQ